MKTTPRLLPAATRGGRRFARRPIPPPRSAFTLIELLTVIAIIGVLAAIILSVVGKVRHEARMVTSTNRMRNIGTAYTLYVNDNRQKLILPSDPASTAQPSDHAIQLAIAPYMSLPTAGSGLFHDPVWWDAYAEINGIRAMTGAGALYHPTAPQRNKITGFAFNYYIRRGADPRFVSQLTQVKNPSRLALVFSRRDDGAAALWNVWADGRPASSDNPRSYGAKRLFCYFDGHVERQVINGSNYDPSNKFNNNLN